jgi:hypothetical protein
MGVLQSRAPGVDCRLAAGWLISGLTPWPGAAGLLVLEGVQGKPFF